MYCIHVKFFLYITELLYSYNVTCGRSSQSGEWFNNGLSTGMNSNVYTITNANFSHDGEYQCKRGGVNVLDPPLLVIVYGECSVQVKVV